MSSQELQINETWDSSSNMPGQATDGATIRYCDDSEPKTARRYVSLDGDLFLVHLCKECVNNDIFSVPNKGDNTS